MRSTGFFDYGDVVTSSAERGQIRINIGDVDKQTGYGVSLPVWGPDGYLAMPNDPGNGAARAFYFKDGTNARVFAFSDNRFAAQAGTLKPGDRMIVTDAACRIFMKRETAHVGLYTEAKDEPPVGGKGMTVDLNGDDGKVVLRAGGCSIVLDGQAGTITLIAAGPSGTATLTLDAVNGASLVAGIANIDAGTVTLGATGGAMRPGTPGVDSAIYGAMGQSGIASSCVFIAK